MVKHAHMLHVWNNYVNGFHACTIKNTLVLQPLQKPRTIPSVDPRLVDLGMKSSSSLVDLIYDMYLSTKPCLCRGARLTASLELNLVEIWLNTSEQHWVGLYKATSTESTGNHGFYH